MKEPTMLFNPATESFESRDPRTREIMKLTVEFFEKKGKAQLKEDDHERRWYRDFIDFIKDNRIFSTLLTPPQYNIDDPEARWDTRRNCDFNEVLGFYGLNYWYAWQVSILGLGPLWMADGEAIKRITAEKLRDGGVFGFGLSEKDHGADLYSSEMKLTPMPDGSFRADGDKYYIGNGNEAALLSVFGKNSETDEYVFFAVKTDHSDYEDVKNIVKSQMHVSEFALRGYPVSADEVLVSGPRAWDAALNTVNIGKFNLGWASIGICTHALYEALKHAANRELYGKYVTDFPHVKHLLTDAYTRLVAMRLFSTRASDYMRVASAKDRRYLLYNPMVKMKVTTQGEEVINNLWEVIAAKGFEKDTFFEMAVRDIRALPKLEGTVHVNMALVVKFMANFLFNPAEYDEVSPQTQATHDAFLFDQGPTRGLGAIQFHDPEIAYGSIQLPNVEIFKTQIKALKALLSSSPPDKKQKRDMDFLLSLGELFSLVVYGQLILESAKLQDVDNQLLDQIFDFMVRDFSLHALNLYSTTSTTSEQADHCLKMIHRPAIDESRFTSVWERFVLVQKDAYEMSP
ncbi:MAG: acyl-CoA dehydrogenase [Acidobacteria bacterium]|nr:MAG: acyl-CoA dehydrogenase [Acidobacteriota bacterium]